MTVRIDPKAWTEGFKDAYAAKPKPAEPMAGDELSYASGRVEGEALRLKHQQEFERVLFTGRRVRPSSRTGASRG